MNTNRLPVFIRHIFLTIFFSGIGGLTVLFITKGLDIELSKLSRSILMFLVSSASILLLFPGVLKIPFGKRKIGVWLKELGIYLPERFYMHILLGLLLGLVSLTGMLLGSIVTGKYVFSLSNVTPAHLVFSLTPGIWEEVLFRGVMMMILISWLKDLKKAFWWQTLVFALCHISGFTVSDLVEIISVFIIGITFSLAAVKTRTLIAGIIYHYIHDAFLFLVQNPGGEYHGFQDNMTFYVFLWIFMLINIMIVMVFTERMNVKGERRIYRSEGKDDEMRFIIYGMKNSKRASRVERISMLLFAISAIPVLMESTSIQNRFLPILLGIIIVMNLAGFYLYTRIRNYNVYIVLFLNSLGSLVTGYQLKSGGSQRVYIFYFLIGIFYILLIFFKLSFKKDKLPATGAASDHR